MKRFARSDSTYDSIEAPLRRKRVIPSGPTVSDDNWSQASASQSSQPPFDARRAASARQHVRALNTQFASWVQSQLENHSDELWEDGVQDYLTHASKILEKFKDVVDWLKANAEKAETVSFATSNAEKSPLSEAKTGRTNSLPNSNIGLASEGSTLSAASPWSFGLNPGKFKQTVPGTSNPFMPATNQNAAPARQAASDDPEDDELEKPSSPSVKKTEEQGILVVHEVKCKVYVKPDDPVDKAWKDMGMGQLSIKCKEGASKGTQESKPTVIVRNDVGKVLLNALLYPGIKMNIQKNTITTIFHTLAPGQSIGNELGNAVAAARTYLLRTKTEDDTNKLAEAIKEYAPAA